jgi:hypothetical protein
MVSSLLLAHAGQEPDQSCARDVMRTLHGMPAWEHAETPSLYDGLKLCFSFTLGGRLAFAGRGNTGLRGS